MRWVVILLLLANIGYAGWYLLVAEAEGPAVVVRSPAPDNLERLRLLEESDAVRSACIEVGPFPAEGGESRTLLSLAESKGMSGTLMPRPVADQPHYWVLIPPGTEADGEAQVAMLAEEGFEAFLISGGELANGVSLGIFPDEAQARAEAERLRERAFEPEVRVIEQSRTRLFVELRMSRQAFLADSELNARFEEAAGLTLTEKLCETIAP